MSLIKVNIGLLVTISLFTIIINAEVGVKKSSLEPTLEDVMTNITRVNRLLQDLIKNYKTLKKISNPEPEESDYGADKEVDWLNNDRKRSKYRSEVKSSTEKAHKAYATAMFFFNSEIDENVGQNQEHKREKALKKANKQKKRQRDIQNDKEKSIDMVNQYEKERQNIGGRHTVKTHKVSESKDLVLAENIGKSLAKKDDIKAANKSEKTLMPAIVALRKIIKSFTDAPDVSKDATSSSLTALTTFSKAENVLELKTASTPKSKKHLEPRLENFEMRTIKRIGKQGSYTRKSNGETEEKFGVLDLNEHRNDNKKTSSASDRTKNLEPLIKQSREYDSGSKGEILKEEIKANALREAYGDACLTLVIRKCYMACRGVSKEICHGRHSCSKRFKKSFKKHAIHGCNMQFNNHTTNFRVMTDGDQARDGNTTNGFVDLTRDGYLSMACWQGGNKDTARNQKQNAKVDSELKRLNILRDKYELACQKASRLKCYKACKHASTQACGEETCRSAKVRAMEKSCKRRCTQRFGGGGDHSDSSDDSDSSKSESERKKSGEDW